MYTVTVLVPFPIKYDFLSIYMYILKAVTIAGVTHVAIRISQFVKSFFFFLTVPPVDLKASSISYTCTYVGVPEQAYCECLLYVWHHMFLHHVQYVSFSRLLSSGIR